MDAAEFPAGEVNSDEAPILVEGDSRLRDRSLPVATAGVEVDRVIARLAATLAAARRKHGFGRALAAPQLGIPRRIVVADLGAGPFALLNPEIHWRSAETFEVWDDCFSLPGQLVRVRRHRSVSLTYRDAQFRLRRWEKLPPDLAELLQHEVDHLDGILMTDRAAGDDALRPASARAQLIDAARPARRLSLQRIEAASRQIDPVFLETPQFLCEPLSERVGCSLTLKIETLNPIRSFKGRGASLFVADRAERDSSTLVCASAGNFGQGLAYACRRRGIPLVVYAACDANAFKVERMRSLGADVRLFGQDFDAAKEAAQSWAEANGAVLVVDGLDVAISEGAGTIARELLARGDAYDAVFVPLGNGALINGVARWVKARSPATRVIGVCSRGAPVMAEAFRRGLAGAVVQDTRPDTIADGIAVRVPIPEAVADMVDLVDDVVLTGDAEIIEAMRLIHRYAGVLVEPAGAAGLAAMLSAPDLAGSAAATVLCGGNLTPDQVRAWLGATDLSTGPLPGSNCQ